MLNLYCLPALAHLHEDRRGRIEKETAHTSSGAVRVFCAQGQVKHALAALACGLATALSYAFHLPSGQFFVCILIMTLGMPPAPQRALLLGIGIGGSVSAVILLRCGAPSPLPGRDVAVDLHRLAVQQVVFPAGDHGRHGVRHQHLLFFSGTVGDTLNFYVAYWLNWLVGAASVVVIDAWCRSPHERSSLSGSPRSTPVGAGVPAGGRGFGRAAAAGTETGRGGRVPALRATAPNNPRAAARRPFARMILACRLLNLRLWFFSEPRPGGDLSYPPKRSNWRAFGPLRRTPPRLARRRPCTVNRCHPSMPAYWKQ